MLPRDYRLTRAQFWRVTQLGQSIAFSECVAKFLPNQLDHSRFGMVTSAKLNKKAVVRNRLRRWIYWALSSKSMALAVDVIIFPKQAMLNLSRDQISTCLDQVLSKIFQLA